MKQYHANEQIVARVQMATGLTHREAQVAVLSTTAAIIEQLLDGKEVLLRGLGTLHFRMAKGRKIPERQYPGHKVIPAVVLNDRPLLKFNVNPELKKKLAGIAPEVVRKGQYWSDKRRQHQALRQPAPPPTPSPSPKPADAALPSSQALADGAALE